MNDYVYFTDTSTLKLDLTYCTTIESAKELQNVLEEVITSTKKLESVLKEVSGVQYDKICRDLDIKIVTCNSMERKDVFTLVSAKELENVLNEVSGVQYNKICRELDIKIGTCNSLGRKDAFTLSQKCTEQHPEPCWENIIQVL